MIISRSILRNIRNVSYNIVEKMKTHISRSITFFFESRAVYDVRWKNILEPGRLQIAIGYMRIECWITKDE